MTREARATGEVKVLLFATYRDAVGTPELALSLDEAPTVGGAWAALTERWPELARTTPSAAVNATFVDAATALAPGDEVAFLPPVSGG